MNYILCIWDLGFPWKSITNTLRFRIYSDFSDYVYMDSPL